MSGQEYVSSFPASAFFFDWILIMFRQSGRDRVVDGFTTICAISAYHQ